MIAQRRSLAEHGKIAVCLAAEHMPEWLELTRQRALTVAALRRLNAECDAFRATVSSGGMREPMGAESPASKLLG